MGPYYVVCGFIYTDWAINGTCLRNMVCVSEEVILSNNKCSESS